MSAALRVEEPSPKYLAAPQASLVQAFDQVARAPEGVARLRELILSLAVRGRLVPQDSSDEPAPHLLNEIATEKDRQIAAGRIKPDKTLYTLADASPFEIPASWAWVPMGEVVEIVRGITFPASEKTKEAALGRIACLRTSNIQETVEWCDLLFVDRSFVGRDAQLLKPYDIVMSMANSRELVGKVALVDHIPYEVVTFGGFLGVIRPWKIEPRYAMALLRSSYARSTLIESSSQTTNIANISLGKLRPLPFSLPPLAEQARIVARVDELMRLCDALEAKGRLEAEQHARLLDTLLGTLTDSTTPEELATNWQRVATHFDLLLDRPAAVDALEKTIVQLAVRGLLVPQDSRVKAKGGTTRNRPGGRDDWTRSHFGDVVSMLNGYAFKSEWFKASGVRLVRNINVSHGHLDWHQAACVSPTMAEEFAQFALVEGDVVLTLDRPIISTGLKLAVVGANDLPCLLLQRVARLSPDSKVLTSDFMLLWLSSDLFLNAIDPGRSNGVPHISTKQVAALAIDLPPLVEQSRIVTRVTQLRRLCADLRQRFAAQQAVQSHLADALVEQALA